MRSNGYPVKDHSYEEVRAAMLAILSGRETTTVNPLQNVEHLQQAVAGVFGKRENPGVPMYELFQGQFPRLSAEDAALCSEAFWDLFLERIVTLGYDGSNREYPFFRISHLGKAILANQQVYFFHDVSTYEAQVKAEVPAIDATTLLYLKEAMQAFRSGCILSATVMLGVATEHTFLLLLETIDANPKWQAIYAKVQKERQILPKINKFRSIIDPRISALPPDAQEDFDTHFVGIQSIIRTFRNNAGHPSGKIIDREQAYVLLNLFIPYAKKMYQLMDYFKQ